MNALIQRRFFVRREVRIDAQGVYVTLVKYGKVNEVFIDFEQIIGRKVSMDTSTDWLAWVGLFVAVPSLFGMLGFLLNGDGLDMQLLTMAAIGVGLLLTFQWSRNSYWKIACQDGLFIYVHKDIPDEQTVNRFIAELMERRDDYLLANYGEINGMLQYEGQFRNLNWLKSYEVIDVEEYERRKAELDRIFQREARPIGFFHN